jgi:hypothetical protein
MSPAQAFSACPGRVASQGRRRPVPAAPERRGFPRRRLTPNTWRGHELTAPRQHDDEDAVLVVPSRPRPLSRTASASQSSLTLRVSLGTACAEGLVGYSASPGSITVQACWWAASLAQAVFAALADRLLRRARVHNSPAKGRDWQKLDLSSGKQICQCSVNAVGDFTGLYLTAECTHLDRPGATTCCQRGYRRSARRGDRRCVLV